MGRLRESAKIHFGKAALAERLEGSEEELDKLLFLF
jgi:hypothetical protein